MLDWLNIGPLEVHTARVIVLRLLVATVLGVITALIHRYTRPIHEHTSKGFVPTLVLLSILLAMVVLVVGTNVAWAFSLAGIMAIVRFRTTVEDIRDAVFVICAVVVGMAAGAGFHDIAFIGLPLVALAAYVTQRNLPFISIETTRLKIRSSLAADSNGRFEELLERYAFTWTIVETSTARQGSALDLVYEVRLKPDTRPLEMLREFNRLDGVQEVEWKTGT
jgi:uncharacterized membrane protein YhiD involved in acid resistance